MRSPSRTASRVRAAFSPPEWRRVGSLSGAVALLHVAGFGLLALYASPHPQLVALGMLAYSFGLRHAFDADHISAIDNTTRKFLQQGRCELGTGFFFSLGHSTIVLSLAVALVVGAKAVGAEIPHFQEVGGTIGAGVSGSFLWIIGILNLVVLRDIARMVRDLRGGRFDEAALEQRLIDRGFMNRFFIGRFFGLITRSWHMYPLGVLFGLGFDTASEVGLLAVTAGAASGSVPITAVLALPLLFAAGMALMDTADGVFMAKAYGWAFSSPVRKVYYNLTVTSLSVFVALLVGSVELLQVLADRLHLRSGFAAWIGGLNFEILGYVIVGVFAVTWAGALVVWRLRRVEERWLARPGETA
jgi:nickel/cobalt transporter (NiCoT) family protein